MKNMIAMALLALLTSVAVVPANAQYGYGSGFASTTASLQARINRGVSDGRLSQHEARNLQRRLSQINDMEMRMRSTGMGLSRMERARLSRRVANLNMQINRELNDFERRRIGFYGGGRRWF